MEKKLEFESMLEGKMGRKMTIGENMGQNSKKQNRKRNKKQKIENQNKMRWQKRVPRVGKGHVRYVLHQTTNSGRVTYTHQGRRMPTCEVHVCNHLGKIERN